MPLQAGMTAPMPDAPPQVTGKAPPQGGSPNKPDLSHLPGKARDMINAAKIALTDDKFKPIFDQMVQNAKDFPAAAATMTFMLVMKCVDQLGPLPGDILFEDKGVADAILDLIFQYVQHLNFAAKLAGKPELVIPVDEDMYVQAMNDIEDMAIGDQGAQGDAQQPSGMDDQQGAGQQAPPQTPSHGQAPGAPPQAAPPQMPQQQERMP